MDVPPIQRMLTTTFSVSPGIVTLARSMRARTISLRSASRVSAVVPQNVQKIPHVTLDTGPIRAVGSAY